MNYNEYGSDIYDNGTRSSESNYNQSMHIRSCTVAFQIQEVQLQNETISPNFPCNTNTFMSDMYAVERDHLTKTQDIF